MNDKAVALEKLEILDIYHRKRDRKGNAVCLVRNVPKRDKSISARQWKKRQKAQRREAKKAA